MKTQTTSPKGSSDSNPLRNNIKEAQKKWDKITHAEFTDLDGSSSKLTKLVESRYNIEHKEAEKQVQKFLDLH